MAAPSDHLLETGAGRVGPNTEVERRLHNLLSAARRVLVLAALFYVTSLEPISPRLGETDVRLLWVPGALLGFAVWLLPRSEVPFYVVAYALVRLTADPGPTNVAFEFTIVLVELTQALVLATALRRHLRREQLILQPVRVIYYPLLALVVTAAGASAVLLAAELLELSPDQMSRQFAGDPALAWRHWWLGQTTGYIAITGSINFLAQVSWGEFKSFFDEARVRLGFATMTALLVAITLLVMPVADLSGLGLSAEVRLGLTMIPASIAFAMAALFLGFGAACAILIITPIAMASLAGANAAANWQGVPPLTTPVHVYLTLMAATCWAIATTTRQMYWAKQEVIEAGKLRARFAGMLTEELRSQLDAILGYSERMQLEEQGAQRPLENIQASSRRLLATIEALIDQAEYGASIFELDKLPVRLVDPIGEAVESTRPECERLGCTLSMSVGPDLVVEADRRALRQVLMVLLSYPLRFAGPGASVCVSARSSAADTILEIESSGLINAVADDRDKIELQLVSALALAHGARLTTVQNDRSGRLSRLTFFATQAA